MQTECQTRNVDPDQTACRAATIQLLHDTIHIAIFMIPGYFYRDISRAVTLLKFCDK